MKKLIIMCSVLFLFSCGNDADKTTPTPVESEIAPYDTIAIDSFSAGAQSVDVAKQIKISSVKYQDSIKEAFKKIEAEKIAEKENLEKEKKEKVLEDEKKKIEEKKNGENTPKTEEIKISSEPPK